MKYIKLYEKFKDDFEEVWEEDPTDDKIKKHKLPKIFVDFLNKENALDKFIHNFEEKYPNIIWYSWATNYEMKINRIIIESFIWNYTPEGSDYWITLHIKWQNFLNKKILDNPDYVDKVTRKIKELKKSELYENFEDDFEETWIDEPDDNLDYKFIKQEDYDSLLYDKIYNIFLIEKYKNPSRFILYNNLYKFANVPLISLNDVISKNDELLKNILSNKISFKINIRNEKFEKRWERLWKTIYFNDLPIHIQNKILKSYDI